MSLLESTLQKFSRPEKQSQNDRSANSRLSRFRRRRKEHKTPPPPEDDKKKFHRTIFVSDTHLGTRGCKAELLADFLRHNEAETLFLVGDIIDGWRLQRSWYWPESHNDVVQEILRKSREGTHVIYVPGNHDEGLRAYCGHNFGDVELLFETIHETADNKKFLVMHGDHFDGVVKYARWLAIVGDRAYGIAMVVSDVFNVIRRRLGMPYWSLSAYLKHKVKNAVEYVGQYEDAIIREAARRGVDGVICGHVHHAEIRQLGDVTYCNDGDWVESCTALVEDFDGHLEIMTWTELGGARKQETKARVAA